MMFVLQLIVMIVLKKKFVHKKMEKPLFSQFFPQISRNLLQFYQIGIHFGYPWAWAGNHCTFFPKPLRLIIKHEQQFSRRYLDLGMSEAY